MANRASSTIFTTKRSLWMEMSVAETISWALYRWWMYARE